MLLPIALVGCPDPVGCLGTAGIPVARTDPRTATHTRPCIIEWVVTVAMVAMGAACTEEGMVDTEAVCTEVECTGAWEE
jgi:hypothetical protein